MTLKSYELVPILSTPAKIEKAKVAVELILKDAGRKYVPMAKPVTSFPASPRDPGLVNNQHRLPAYLCAYWLFGDRNALQSAVNHAKWLASDFAERDRAHCHPFGWWPAVGLAAQESALASPLFFDMFMAWYFAISNKDAEGKYLYTWTGSTLRPLVVSIGEAVHTAWVAWELVDANLIALPNPVPLSLQMLAERRLEEWAEAIDPKRGHWLHEKPSPSWDEFCYQDGSTWARHCSESTFFHGAVKVAWLGFMVKLFGDMKSCGRLSMRLKQMARHSIGWGYDARSGKSVKSIADEKLGSWEPPGTPGGISKPLSQLDVATVEKIAEQGYHSLALPFLAYYSDKAETRKALVNWLAKGARCLEPGQVPLDIVAACLQVTK